MNAAMSAAMNDAMSTDIRGLASDAATFRITSIDALRSRYAQPGERAVKKQLAALDVHCRRFVGLSPLLVISSAASCFLTARSPGCA